MGGDDVALGREMLRPEPVEPRLVFGMQPETEDERLLARWLDLTRRILPEMAARHAWPIDRDHCFMRAILDSMAGGVWHRHIRRPAIRTMTHAQLAHAVALAERVVAQPGLLPILNRQSLAWRASAD